MKILSNLRRSILIGIFLVVAIMISWTVFIDRKDMLVAIGEIKWHYIPFALFFTMLSYCFLSLNFIIFSRIFGVRQDRKKLFEMGFVSNVVNNLISAGGVAQHSFRLLIMKGWGEKTSDILATSFFQIYLNALALMSILPISLLKLLKLELIAKNIQMEIIISVVILFSSVFLFTLIFFHQPTRRSGFHILSGVWHFITHKEISGRLANLNESMENGLTIFRKRPLLLLSQFILLVCDWSAAIITLWFCFQAFSIHLRPSVVAAGFSIGLIAGMISLIPGGIGIQDGSMAGIFALFGVPFSQAIFVALLFRLVYYFFPAIISLSMYRHLLSVPPPRSSHG